MTTKLPTHDQLAALAEKNPERLEELREIWVNEIIDSAPAELRRRLRGLQFQIDCKRKMHSNPMGACVEISKMMYDSLHKLNRIMNGKTDSNTHINTSDTATVLAFPTAG